MMRSFHGNRLMTGEKVGCCFWGAMLSDLGEELAVLGLEEGAEGAEIVSGNGVEERVVHGHWFVSSIDWLPKCLSRNATRLCTLR